MRKYKVPTKLSHDMLITPLHTKSSFATESCERLGCEKVDSCSDCILYCFSYSCPTLEGNHYTTTVINRLIEYKVITK